MTDEDVRKSNREDVWVYLDRARSEEGFAGSGEETELRDLVLVESGSWRRAMLNVGGALAYAILDLADAIREHARRG